MSNRPNNTPKSVLVEDHRQKMADKAQRRYQPGPFIVYENSRFGRVIATNTGRRIWRKT